MSVQEVIFAWNCDQCQHCNQPVNIVPHPIFGSVRAVTWPDYEFMYLEARASWFCVCYPVNTEETTWGRLKALYAD